MVNLVCAHKVLPGNEKFTEQGPQNLHMYDEATHLKYFLSVESMEIDKFKDKSPLNLWVGEWESGWVDERVGGLTRKTMVGKTKGLK